VKKIIIACLIVILSSYAYAEDSFIEYSFGQATVKSATPTVSLYPGRATDKSMNLMTSEIKGKIVLPYIDSIRFKLLSVGSMLPKTQNENDDADEAKAISEFAISFFEWKEFKPQIEISRTLLSNEYIVTESTGIIDYRSIYDEGQLLDIGDKYFLHSNLTQLKFIWGNDGRKKIIDGSDSFGGISFGGLKIGGVDSSFDMSIAMVLAKADGRVAKLIEGEYDFQTHDDYFEIKDETSYGYGMEGTVTYLSLPILPDTRFQFGVSYELLSGDMHYGKGGVYTTLIYGKKDSRLNVYVSYEKNYLDDFSIGSVYENDAEGANTCGTSDRVYGGFAIKF